MPGSLTADLIRALDPARPGPSDLRMLVVCLNPNSPHPDCRDAAAAKLQEIFAATQRPQSGYSCYSLHVKLLGIALELENRSGIIGAVDSTLPFLERMKRVVAGAPILRMSGAFLERTGPRRLDPPELREALWLNNLNSLPESDSEGTVLDLGSPAALKVQAEFTRLFLDSRRVDSGDLRELLDDADPAIRKNARRWLARREEREAVPAPAGGGDPAALERWNDGPHLFRAGGEDLTLEVSPRQGPLPRYRVVTPGRPPVFLMAGEFMEAVDAVVKAFGRIHVGRDPGLSPEDVLSSESGSSPPKGKAAPLSFSWLPGKEALAVQWNAAGITWILRPSGDDLTVMIVEGSLKGVIDHYFESL